MITTLIQMTLIIACGIAWRIISPAGLNAEQSRKVLTTVVYTVFLPALVLEVLWSTKLGLQSFEYTLLGGSGILITLLIIWILCRVLKFGRKQTGAVLLATAFPNVTYLGLPVLQQTFGNWARSVAIQLDLFAAAPLVFTVGIMIARYYGENKTKPKHLLSFLTTPPFLAAFVAVLLNINQIAIPLWLAGVLQQMSDAVVPLMLFSLGLALHWDTIRLKNFSYIVPVLVIKLLFMPWLVLEMVTYMTVSEEHKAAVVLDMAMPSMVLGIVLCDQYKLDSALYAMAVAMTTLLSILTLPYWYSMV